MQTFCSFPSSSLARKYNPGPCLLAARNPQSDLLLKLLIVECSRSSQYAILHQSPSSNNRIARRVILGHAHIRIDRRRKRRETRASQRRSLRTAALRQEATRQTSSSDTIAEIVLRTVSLNRTLGTREDRADVAEVLCRGPGRAAHFLEALAQLLFDGEGGEGVAAGGGGHGGVVAHGRHEETEDAAETEAHDTGHGELAGT